MQQLNWNVTWLAKAASNGIIIDMLKCFGRNLSWKIYTTLQPIWKQNYLQTIFLPLPLINDSFKQPARCKVFSTIDLYFKTYGDSKDLFWSTKAKYNRTPNLHGSLHIHFRLKRNNFQYIGSFSGMYALQRMATVHTNIHKNISFYFWQNLIDTSLTTKKDIHRLSISYNMCTCRLRVAIAT